MEAEIERTFERLERRRGTIQAVSSHLSPTIPADMLDRYFKALLPRLERKWARGGRVARQSKKIDLPTSR